MLIGILLYIGMAVLLITGAAWFFARALKNLTNTKTVTNAPDHLPLSEQLGDAQTRAAIIAMLERQFHNSPSIDP